MKDLGKTKILGIDVYVDRSRCQYSCANVHRWNIEWSSIWKQREKFLPHGRGWNKIRVFFTLDEWSHVNDLIDHVYHDMYISRYVLCSKCYEHIPEW
jgi:hypothetical protein